MEITNINRRTDEMFVGVRIQEHGLQLYGLMSRDITICNKEYSCILLVPVCNPTLQVIGLQIPCMERAGVVVGVHQLLLRLN